MKLDHNLLNRLLLGAWRAALLFGLACVVAVGGASSQPATNQPTTTANNFLEVPVRPVAIGHHGVGPNLGGDPTIPIENTVDSVRLAYSLGARVVEVDVQLTADGKLAVFHNDFLDDFTCVDSLTIDQLQQRMPFVPELHQVLAVARQANRQAGNALGGILIVELKALSPHCDPGDNLEQKIVSTAVAEIHQAKYGRPGDV
jgi:glycerophosphoryl diester phosphodiesterase